MYSWGRGQYGVLGQGDEQPRNIPSLVTSLPFTDIVHIDAGHSYAAAVSLINILIFYVLLTPPNQVHIDAGHSYAAAVSLFLIFNNRSALFILTLGVVNILRNQPRGRGVSV